MNVVGQGTGDYVQQVEVGNVVALTADDSSDSCENWTEVKGRLATKGTQTNLLVVQML